MVLREFWDTGPRNNPYTFEIIITAGGSFGAMPATYIDDIIAEVGRSWPPDVRPPLCRRCRLASDHVTNHDHHRR